MFFQVPECDIGLMVNLIEEILRQISDLVRDRRFDAVDLEKAKFEELCESTEYVLAQNFRTSKTKYNDLLTRMM